MKITKLEHSGLVIENQGELLVCDPVEINEKLPIFSNVSVLVITHKHSDHFQPQVVEKIMAENPNARIFTTEDNASGIAGATAVIDGDYVQVGKFDLRFFGADHAEIFPGKPLCQNIGVVVNGSLAHPGDAFKLPPEKIDVLCLPVVAPWCKVSEVADYLKNVAPRTAIAIHDALLSDFGRMINDNNIKSFAGDIGVDYHSPRSGESVEI